MSRLSSSARICMLVINRPRSNALGAAAPSISPRAIRWLKSWKPAVRRSSRSNCSRSQRCSSRYVPSSTSFAQACSTERVTAATTPLSPTHSPNDSLFAPTRPTRVLRFPSKIDTGSETPCGAPRPRVIQLRTASPKRPPLEVALAAVVTLLACWRRLAR